jgi:hypothetical protein
MPLQGSGTISLSNVNVELGRSATATISMNETAVRTLGGVASGVISMSNFHGKSNTPTFNLTIASNTANYNLRNSLIAAGWNGSTAVNGTVTINGGVYVYSNSTGSYAFDTGASYPGGSVLSLVNNGSIVGKGGQGAAPSGGVSGGYAGAAGGPGLIAQTAFRITNNSWIAGGGGGGGGFGSGRALWAVGGGGGAGLGAGGTPSGWTSIYPGSAGSLTGGGAGGSYLGTYGNGGGGLGSAGGPATQSNGVPYAGSAGGAAGAAIVGNGNITWLAVGAIYGAIG